MENPSAPIFILNLLRSVLSCQANRDPDFVCSGEVDSGRQTEKPELELNRNG